MENAVATPWAERMQGQSFESPFLQATKPTSPSKLRLHTFSFLVPLLLLLLRVVRVVSVSLCRVVSVSLFFSAQLRLSLSLSLSLCAATAVSNNFYASQICEAKLCMPFFVHKSVRQNWVC